MQTNLDRLSLEISDLGSEEKRHDDEDEALGDPEYNFNWELEKSDPHSNSDSEMGNRVKLRNRSHSEYRYC